MNEQGLLWEGQKEEGEEFSTNQPGKDTGDPGVKVRRHTCGLHTRWAGKEGLGPQDQKLDFDVFWKTRLPEASPGEGGLSHSGSGRDGQLLGLDLLWV